MKKISSLLKVFAVCLIFLSVGFVFSACGKHVHKFSDWTITKAATCTEVGKREKVCECGEVVFEDIPMTEHTFGDWSVETPATCTTNGLEFRLCTACQKREEQEIVSKGHTIVVEEGYSASCGVPGLTEGRYCEVCNEVFAEQEEIPALEHVFGAWYPVGDVVVSGNEQFNGTHRHDCTNAGCQYYETGVCTYTTTTFEPTCTEDGYNIHECETCHYSFHHDEVEKLGHNFSGTIQADEHNPQHHKVFCANKNCTEFESVECDFEKGAHTPVTCLENGYDTYNCRYCTNTYNQTEPEDIAQGHKYDGQWHYDEEHPHNHKHACLVCGAQEHVTCDEQIFIKEASCQEAGFQKTVCSTCGNEVVDQVYDKLPHSYGPWTYEGSTKEDRVHKRTCLNCEAFESDHCRDWVREETDATCEAAGTVVEYCPTCKGGFTSEGQPAKDHNFSAWEYDASNPGHHKHYCLNGCGKEETAECQHTASITLEDCVNDGKTTYTCSYCQNQYDEVRPKLGHLWVEEGSVAGAGEWEIDLEAGTHTRRCKRADCGFVETGIHTYNETNLCDACQHDGLVYEVRNGYAVVVHDDKVLTARKIIIADTYNKYPVEEICSGLDKYQAGKSCGFFNNRTVEEIVLPKSLKKIGSYAFTTCPNLKRVVYAGSEQNLVSIEAYAFDYCPKLVEIHLPETLTSIEKYAFNSCSSLENIIIPEKVVHIGANAFGQTAFMRKWERSNAEVLYLNGHLIKAKTSLAGSYTIEEGTKTISVDAFKDCRLLTTIIIPQTIIESDEDAFLGCTNLEKVIFMGSFADWIAIKFANDYASPMSVCDHIEIKGAHDTIEIPASVTQIPAGAFKGTSITKVHIPATVTYIGEEAFENCTELEIEFDPDCRFTYVGQNAFTGSKFIKETPLWNNGVLYVGHCLVTTNADFTAAEYTIEEGTIAISPNAFGENFTLTSVVLPGSLQFIWKAAFKGCYALKKARFLGNTNWFAFMELGAGRMPSPQMLSGISENEAEAAHYQSETARMLTEMYTGVWKRTLM